MRNTVFGTVAVAILVAMAGAARAQAPVQLRGKASGGKSYIEHKSDQVFAAFLTFQPARTVEEQQNRLASLRASAVGAMMLSASVVLAAHAPARLRPVVDGVVHLGPAVFDGGGMGAGI